MIEKTPKKIKKVLKKNKTNVISSDSEEDTKTKKIPKKMKTTSTSTVIKPINIDDLNKPVKQIKPFKNENKKDLQISQKEKGREEKNTELDIHKNTDFEKTLMELDEDSNDTILMDNIDLLDKTFEEALHNDNEDKEGNFKQTPGSIKKMGGTNKKRQRKKSDSNKILIHQIFLLICLF